MLTIVFVIGCFAIPVAIGSLRHITEQNKIQKRTATNLRDQLMREIAEVQTMNITRLKASPHYQQRVNDMLNSATYLIQSTNVDQKGSVHAFTGGLALVSQARAIVEGAGAH